MNDKQTRAARRRDSRRTDTGGQPPRRDFMRWLYGGLAVFVIALAAIIGYFQWQEKRAFAAATATPSPDPNSVAGIQLVDQTSIGKPTFKQGDTQRGGHGSPVDGIKCDTAEYATLHVHGHLALFVNGKQIQVPKYVGFAPQGKPPCLYWVHTHDASGIIHIESPVIAPFTLGSFFNIWGMDLRPNRIATFSGPVTAYVNANRYFGDFRAIPITAHTQVTLEVGAPLVPPPNYKFPPQE
ncbi:MAG: hypothetical protein M3160_06360 [Candidatus Eremiobacteraeota bacterium]|nr:hypothetical protein [Candidatus Eremiobacteraeota bacterium]